MYLAHRPSVIYIALDNISLKSNVVRTDVFTMLGNIETYFEEEKQHPYAYLLNQYLDCDFDKIKYTIAKITTDLTENKSETPCEALILELQNSVNDSENLYEQHFYEILRGNYTAAFAPEFLAESPSKRLQRFEACYQDLMLSKYELLDILAAYDIMPYHEISKEKKREILTDPVYGYGYINARNQMSTMFFPVVQYFILSMKASNLHFQQCKICGKLFVRTTKKKSAFCCGSYCDEAPTVDAKERYRQKQETFEYLMVYKTTREYFNQRVNRGSMTDEERQRWKKEAQAYKKKVEAGSMSEETFIRWLLDQKQAAIAELQRAREV